MIHCIQFAVEAKPEDVKLGGCYLGVGYSASVHMVRDQKQTFGWYFYLCVLGGYRDPPINEVLQQNLNVV